MSNKRHIIVLDGPDMTGKTQIVAALSKELNVPKFKASSEHETFLSKQNLFLHQLRHALPRELDLLEQGCISSIIYDRSWPAEFVYSTFYDRNTDWQILRYVDQRMARLGAKIVICHRSTYKGIVDDIQPLIKEKELEKIDSLYREFANWSHCKTMFLNVDDENLEREISEILDFVR